MKELFFSWRWWVQFTLFSAGAFAVMLIFGDDDRPLAQWLEIRAYLAAFAAVCFYTLARLIKRWERNPKLK